MSDLLFYLQLSVNPRGSHVIKTVPLALVASKIQAVSRTKYSIWVCSSSVMWVRNKTKVMYNHLEPPSTENPRMTTTHSLTDKK